jgi:hypothetical protein
MMRIFHPDHGYVITNDQQEIDKLLAKGGQVEDKKTPQDPMPEDIKEDVQEHLDMGKDDIEEDLLGDNSKHDLNETVDEKLQRRQEEIAENAKPTVIRRKHGVK